MGMHEGINCKITFPTRERFRGHEYDPATKTIYESCTARPIGYVKNGKIVWKRK